MTSFRQALCLQNSCIFPLIDYFLFIYLLSPSQSCLLCTYVKVMLKKKICFYTSVFKITQACIGFGDKCHCIYYYWGLFRQFYITVDLSFFKFTLPLAKRYTECVRELMRKTSLHAVSLFPPDLLEGTNMQEVCIVKCNFRSFSFLENADVKILYSGVLLIFSTYKIKSVPF